MQTHSDRHGADPSRPNDPASVPLKQRFPGRRTHWKLRTRDLTFGKLPALMGIVNVTPDSFSDGGQFFDASQAIDHALKLAADGAEILDIGGESTRPYSEPVSASEELHRVIPVIVALKNQTDVPISIDTSKAQIAAEAIAAGAEIINDVTGLEGDANMLQIAAESQAGICAMHMQGTPQTMQDNPAYTDIVAEIHDYLLGRRAALLAAGIDRDRICLDPGIGFGKTHQHNLTLLAHVGRYHALETPLLVGHSRKGFTVRFSGGPEADRTLATVGISLALARSGIQILRVHDVLPHRQALTAFAASGGIDGDELQWDAP